jgi:exodeoxyribonuclease V gamma subunit
MTSPAPHRPGLRLFTSNRLEQLAALLADATRASVASPFEAEVVIVQSQGMARWLQFELARRLGVCANVRFPFPKGFAWELFRAADSSLVTEPDGEPEVLVWRLMRLLPAHAVARGFEPVAHYLADDTEGRKRFQLARRVANLFDQYLIYRPEMILRWEDGIATPGEEWQAALWRALAKETRTPHPARLREKFAAALRADTIAPGKLPSRLSIFGISALPPFYVELFEELARRIPVNMFLLQPTPEYWGDIDSARSTMRALRRANRSVATPSELHHHAGNRLLASLGNQGRDFLNVLLDATEFDAKDHSEPPVEDSLLNSIQADIFHLRDHAERKLVAPNPRILSTDDSLQIHSCHSPLRELEVLRDQMLSWFECDPGLAPQDILVMMPDIETYAPFVEAVFGAAERDRRFIPFSVSDRGTSASSQVLSSFLALLNLAGGRLGASSVLALLEAQAVRARFDLAESDLPQIRRWIDDAGIRWGRDAAHRAQLGLPALAETTWRHGLDRLQQLAAQPGEGIENLNIETLGRFIAFAEAIFAAASQLEQSHPLAAWVELLRNLAVTMFADDDSTEGELRVLRGALRDLEKHARLAAFDESIPLAVLLEHLAPALAEDHLHSGFITGRVTFGALKPMRSIPFKIICLVGMNDRDFPRADTRTGFDLMARAPRLGDQSRREDDRYLFLETLLSARQKFYVSYVGQSVRDNSPAPPSVLVSELLDYVEQGHAYGTPDSDPAGSDEPQRAGSESGAPFLRDHLVTHHRLQAFNEEYFRPGGRLFSYSAENFTACLALREASSPPAFIPQALAPPDASLRTVSVEQLTSFFTNPSKFFAIERLKFKLPRPKSAIADREPIEIDTLEAYSLKSDLLDRKLAGNSLAEAKPLLTAEGRLPLGRVGDALHRKLCDDVAAFHERLRPYHPERRADPQPVDFAVGDFRITGELPAPTPAGQLLFRPATLKAKDLVRAWLTHVLWHAATDEAAGKTTLVGEKAKDRSIVAFASIPGAKTILTGLLDLYWRGMREPLKFFPATSLAFAEADPVDAEQAARKAWASDEYNRGDDSDEYVALCFRNTNPLDEDFAATAQAVFAPMLKLMEVVG